MGGACISGMRHLENTGGQARATMSHSNRKNRGRRRTLSDMLAGPLTALPLVAHTGCGADCELGFDAGEQFRFTVKSLTGDNPQGCGILTLEPGASFVLTAGEKTLDNQEACYERGAVPVVPAPFKSVLTECSAFGGGQLSAQCSGQIRPDCVGGAYFGTPTTIRRGDRVIEDGRFVVGWDGDPCYPVGCTDHYVVRIERLGKLEP
jgi:hypothetical protein